jgi:pyruvate/2-oxoglutarate dehydrogenase complex dihydrolipoamide dehydrogenase (E3) component
MNVASLTRPIEVDVPSSLFNNVYAVGDFFDNNTLLADHINQLKVVASLIGPLLRYVSNVFPSSIVSHPTMRFS